MIEGAMIDPPISSDYRAARARFCAAAEAAGFELERHPVGQRGPRGEELSIDVARRGPKEPARALVVSSGTHGVEGFFGSAAQIAILEQTLKERPADEEVAEVFIHAVNPYGFAWIRRVNEDNVDLNRNFLLESQRFEGGAGYYGPFDALLNPPSAPERLDPFLARAAVTIAKNGFNAVKNAVARGQYDYPRGLFFGGHGPSRSQELLREHLPRWVKGAERVVHIDLHTGMGRWGTYILASSLPSTSERVARLEREFGRDAVQALDPEAVLYEIKGNLGEWCQALLPEVTYDCLLAEFGTHNVMHVISSLREENRAHHFGQNDPEALKKAKAGLLETFCPESRGWQRSSVHKARVVHDQAWSALGGRR